MKMSQAQITKRKKQKGSNLIMRYFDGFPNSSCPFEIWEFLNEKSNEVDLKFVKERET